MVHVFGDKDYGGGVLDDDERACTPADPWRGGGFVVFHEDVEPLGLGQNYVCRSCGKSSAEVADA